MHPIVRALWGLEGGEVGEMKNKEGGVKGGRTQGTGTGAALNSEPAADFGLPRPRLARASSGLQRLRDGLHRLVVDADVEGTLDSA